MNVVTLAGHRPYLLLKHIILLDMRGAFSLVTGRDVHCSIT